MLVIAKRAGATSPGSELKCIFILVCRFQMIMVSLLSIVSDKLSDNARGGLENACPFYVF